MDPVNIKDKEARAGNESNSISVEDHLHKIRSFGDEVLFSLTVVSPIFLLILIGTISIDVGLLRFRIH